MSARAPAIERTRPRLTARAALLIIVVSLLAAFAMAPVREFLGERERIADLERKAQILDDANARLRAEIAKLHDPNELERLARECLGMVNPGETAFVTVPRGGTAHPASC